jgi:hypothetical protein
MTITISGSAYEHKMNSSTSIHNKPWMKVYRTPEEMLQDIINCYNKNEDYTGVIRIMGASYEAPRISAETIGNYITFKCIDKDPAYFWERNNEIKIPFTDSKLFLEKIINKMISKKKVEAKWDIKRIH